MNYDGFSRLGVNYSVRIIITILTHELIVNNILCEQYHFSLQDREYSILSEMCREYFDFSLIEIFSYFSYMFSFMFILVENLPKSTLFFSLHIFIYFCLTVYFCFAFFSFTYLLHFYIFCNSYITISGGAFSMS